MNDAGKLELERYMYYFCFKRFESRYFYGKRNISPISINNLQKYKKTSISEKLIMLSKKKSQ